MAEWTGTLTERGETAKSFKYKGVTPDGKTNTFWQGKDQKPLPMNETITITFKQSQYERQGEVITSKWVEGYAASQSPHTQKTATVAHSNGGQAPFGYVSTAAGNQRTMPTVKEQAIMKAWPAMIEELKPNSGDELRSILKILCTAWEDVMEIGPAKERAHSDEPPPANPDDYGVERQF